MATSKTILVTGANGQLGKEFRVLADSYPQYNFLFTAKEGSIFIIRNYSHHVENKTE